MVNDGFSYGKIPIGMEYPSSTRGIWFADTIVLYHSFAEIIGTLWNHQFQWNILGTYQQFIE
jgi:hypothetical protein